MDGNSEKSPKSPLLGSEGGRSSQNGRRNRRLSRRYSVNSLRTEFLSRLPDKFRSALDVEASPYHIDFTRTRGLSSGLFKEQKLCLVTEKMNPRKKKILFFFQIIFLLRNEKSLFLMFYIYIYIFMYINVFTYIVEIYIDLFC